jgi:hypothetical protein
MAAAAGDRSSKSEGRPPSHFFSKNYDCSDNQLFLSHKQHRRWGQTSLEPAYNMPVATITATTSTRHAEEELLRLRRRGGDELGAAPDDAAAWAHRAFPPMAMAMDVGHLPPRRPPMMVGVGSFKEDDTEDTNLQTESILHTIAIQDEHARRCTEVTQLRHYLEYIHDRRRFEEERMMAEQQCHHLQLNYTTPHEAGQRSESIDDELKIRQARFMRLRSMPTSELLSRLREKLHHSELQMEFAERDCSSGTISSGAASTSALEQAAASIVNDKLRHGRTVSTTTTAPPPPPSSRYWNNGVEVDVRGAPVAASAIFHRFNGSNSATSATPRSAAYDNIVSRFSTLVISCVPEVKAAVSNLLSEIEMVRGFPSDPLIVRSKFPLFVEASWIELKSLGERTKDKELYERVMNCIAAIEPYKTIAELDAQSDYSKIRAIVEEGMASAMDIMLDEASERRAIIQQRKRKGSDLSDSKNAKDAMIVSKMYKKHISNMARM